MPVEKKRKKRSVKNLARSGRGGWARIWSQYSVTILVFSAALLTAIVLVLFILR